MHDVLGPHRGRVRLLSFGPMSVLHSSRHPKVVAVAATVLAASLIGASSALELKAPWSGTALVAAATSLVFAGFVLRRTGHILLLAAAVPAVLLLIDRIFAGGGEDIRPLGSGTCDPTCGISAGGAAILIFLAVLLLTSLGGLVGAVTTRR